MEKAWVIKDTDRYYYRMGVRRATRGLPFVDEKNPARAFTFSLFFWGAGQGYGGLRRKSLLFETLMVLFLAGIGLFSLYAKELLNALGSHGISHAHAFLSAEILLLAVLMFWSYNAGDAYRVAVKARRVPFQGVQNRISPMLCSLVIPGWGQFMNGQPIKGSMVAGFSILGIFSMVTIPAVFFCWPYLEPSHARSLIEAVFAVTVLYAPLIPLVWILSGYDALRVSMDETKKDTLLDRIMLAITRIRIKGWLRGLFPPVRSAVVLALVVLILVVLNGNYFPGNYISARLVEVQSLLQKQGMTLVPDMITRLLAAAALTGI